MTLFQEPSCNLTSDEPEHAFEQASASPVSFPALTELAKEPDPEVKNPLPELAACVAIGAKKSLLSIVTESMFARFGDSVIHPCYGTASMLTHMEWVSYQLLAPFLTVHTGYTAVGTAMTIQHINSAYSGNKLCVQAEIVSIEENKVITRCTAFLDDQTGLLIGTADIEQRVILKARIFKPVKPFDKAPKNFPDLQASEVSDGAKRLPDQSKPANSQSQSIVLDLTDATNHATNHQFQLAVIDWACPVSVCTRYDEWLTASIGLVTKTGETLYWAKDAFLLRYELEALLQQFKQIASGEAPSITSEFLEMPLRVALNQLSADSFQFSAKLLPYTPYRFFSTFSDQYSAERNFSEDAAVNPPKAQPGQSFSAIIDTSQLNTVCTALATTLNQYFSRL
ncbi:MAG: hypothetical protein AAGI66_05910 [Cyanobacteria bacterium P01_H01_bin.74]